MNQSDANRYFAGSTITYRVGDEVIPVHIREIVAKGDKLNAVCEILGKSLQREKFVISDFKMEFTDPVKPEFGLINIGNCAYFVTKNPVRSVKRGLYGDNMYYTPLLPKVPRELEYLVAGSVKAVRVNHLEAMAAMLSPARYVPLATAIDTLKNDSDVMSVAVSQKIAVMKTLYFEEPAVMYASTIVGRIKGDSIVLFNEDADLYPSLCKLHNKIVIGE